MSGPGTIGVLVVSPRSSSNIENRSHSMTAHQSATSGRGLSIALVWWPIAAALAITYFIVIMRKYRGKVALTEDTQGFY